MVEVIRWNNSIARVHLGIELVRLNLACIHSLFDGFGNFGSADVHLVVLLIIVGYIGDHRTVSVSFISFLPETTSDVPIKFYKNTCKKGLRRQVSPTGSQQSNTRYALYTINTVYSTKVHTPEHRR